jgi:hypothetical protein
MQQTTDQKGVIFKEHNLGDFATIYLRKDFYHLHPTWAAENN